MNRVLFLIIAIVLASFTQVFAQKETSLIGRWKVKMEGTDEDSVIEFRNNGKVNGYIVEYTDESGNKQEAFEKAVTDITFNGEKGKCRYSFEWEDESYEVDAKLMMKKSGIIEVSYRYEGYTLKETWTKIK
ncbi:hypothetical protein EYV94_25895 [Puteibacter caeruleilacunae]|nr:hypothetical protein EYV94_25895 [Puteibacter caeruleilacunae]